MGNLLSFDGRVGRGEFWMVGIGLAILSVIPFLLMATGEGVLVLIAVIAYIGLFIGSLATNVKRWHDRDKSGWWMLITLIPIIGGLWALVEQGFLPGSYGENRYGSPSSGSALGS